MNKIKLSFIIPAYNCSSFIRLSLDSIYDTGLDEDVFEVIVTDDCSTDNTLEVLEDYASNHTNMVVLRQERNHRQGAARNRGLKIARGQYVTFVDADDRVMPQMAYALDEAVAGGVDIFCGVSLANYADRPDEFRQFKILSNLPKGKIYDGFEFCSAVLDFCGNNGTPWGYLFKLDFVKANDKLFIEDHLFEETEWISCQFLNAGSIYYSDVPIYKYLYNPLSVSNVNMDISYVVDSSLLAIRMMKLVEKYEDEHPSFVKQWNTYIDKNLLSRGVRLRFLIQYSAADIVKYYRDMGKDNLSYLASHYRGNKKRRMVFRHKYPACAFMCCACTVNFIQRRLRGKGRARTNFYY